MSGNEGTEPRRIGDREQESFTISFQVYFLVPTSQASPHPPSPPHPSSTL